MDFLHDLILNEDYYDENELNEDLEFLRNLMNLREFESIDKHELIIQKELLIFLSEELPHFSPFFQKIDSNIINKYKDKINLCEKISLEDLDDLEINQKNISDMLSFINNLSHDSNISKGSKNKSNLELKKSGSKNQSQGSKKSKSNINISNNFENSNNTSYNIIAENTILEENDFKLPEQIEYIKFEPCEVNNKIIGGLYEADIINYIHKILYALTLGKVNMIRNKKYEYNKIEYELDFQVTNLHIKEFLLFLWLLYPNLSNLDTIEFDIKSLFDNNYDIVNTINNLEIQGKYKDFEFIDILGEITIDYLNIKDKKDSQFEKYKQLVQLLNNIPKLNPKFNFMPNNKKIILIFTDGKYLQFYNSFKVMKEGIVINNKKEENNQNNIIIDNKEDNNKQVKKLDNFIELNYENIEENQNKLSIKENTNIINDNNKQEKISGNKENSNKNNSNYQLEENNKDAKKNIINYLYIFIRNKNDEYNVLKEKIKLKYLNMLENKLNNESNKNKDENKYENKDKDKSEVENKDEDKYKYKAKNSKGENKEIEIKDGLKDLKIADVYNNFFKKVICSKKLDSIRDILQKINNRYLNKIPNLYISHLKINLTNINEIFEPIISGITIKNSNIIKELKNQYEHEKDSFVTLISVFVISEKENFFENYKFNSNKNIKILNYRKKIIKEENIDSLNSDLEEWFNFNSKNKSIIKIIIVRIINIGPFIHKIFYDLYLYIKNKNDFIILYNDIVEDRYKIKQDYKNSIVYEDSNFEEIFLKLIRKNTTNQFIYNKINLMFNYYDKILKDKIIVDNNYNTNNKYIDELIIKIKQDLSIYCNFNIANYKDEIFNEEDLKKEIINKDTNNESFIKKISEEISSLLDKKLKLIDSLDNKNREKIYNKINNIFTNKFTKRVDVLNNIYYKFIEKYYSKNIKKNVQNIIIQKLLSQLDKSEQ